MVYSFKTYISKCRKRIPRCSPLSSLVPGKYISGGGGGCLTILDHHAITSLDHLKCVHMTWVELFLWRLGVENLSGHLFSIWLDWNQGLINVMSELNNIEQSTFQTSKAVSRLAFRILQHSRNMHDPGLACEDLKQFWLKTYNIQIMAKWLCTDDFISFRFCRKKE